MRCFVACWPDSPTRVRLDRIAGEQLLRHPGARRVEAAKLHLTLAFIGELRESVARAAAVGLCDVRAAAFDWRIDRVGRFDRSRVLWAGGADEPRLSDLAERVRTCLHSLRIGFDRKGFAAHVTLLRDLSARRGGDPIDAVEPIEPFDWHIGPAQLVVSERDSAGASRYRPFEP